MNIITTQGIIFYQFIFFSSLSFYVNHWNKFLGEVKVYTLLTLKELISLF